MLRTSLRSLFRPSLRPVGARLADAHERGAPGAGFCATPPTPPGQAAKFFQRPAVWITGALLGGGAAYGLGHDALVQVRRSSSPTRVTVGHGWSEGELRRRLGDFVASLQTVDAVEIHWWGPTTARVVGQYLEGDIRVRKGWVDVTMRVHGPLRVRSQNLHGWMVHNLRQALDA